MKIHNGGWSRAGGDSYAVFWAKSRKQVWITNTDNKEVPLYPDSVVDLKELSKRVLTLENERITDNNDYISIPMGDWLRFKNELTQKGE